MQASVFPAGGIYTRVYMHALTFRPVSPPLPSLHVYTLLINASRARDSQCLFIS